MWQNPRILQSSSSYQILRPPPWLLLHHPQRQAISTPISKHTCCRLSRRDIAIHSGSSSLLLLWAQTMEPFWSSKAWAEDYTSNGYQGESNLKNNGCNNSTPTQRAFLDISIDGKPVGRIVIGLYGVDVPIGTTRFSKLVSGAAGISYRRKEFVKIMPNYIQHGGLRSYGVDVELAKNTGSELAADSLLKEWEKVYEECQGTKNLSGSVSIVVRDPSKPPPKLKLIARKGKLEIDQEEVGVNPNGTEFVITTRDAPELDASSLVVGRVLDGMDVVERIASVKTVQENTSSPYFRVAKLIGDKRAVVAERGFNRPYAKIVITNCGLID
ncbi:peptidyl-prolyl cis-trans isomerase CYP26-2, chloroplastic-like isoform X2 [Telopea speciosissima]|uniref:peptidyl-prolyl cis-trans isomerase CYP26-2, chloroplastic-like isoform X2 n=1 Tax=Telopea speciosissima TaxID=54955 RepID=UPI001CC33CB7|nr:peptidyl-prolyl cis-trans isomerase CYP26-2, chloroplastic-like isoform X2 [Telopea speciosissima]